MLTPRNFLLFAFLRKTFFCSTSKFCVCVCHSSRLSKLQTQQSFDKLSLLLCLKVRYSGWWTWGWDYVGLKLQPEKQKQKKLQKSKFWLYGSRSTGPGSQTRISIQSSGISCSRETGLGWEFIENLGYFKFFCKSVQKKTWIFSMMLACCVSNVFCRMKQNVFKKL